LLVVAAICMPLMLLVRPCVEAKPEEPEADKEIELKTEAQLSEEKLHADEGNRG